MMMREQLAIIRKHQTSPPVHVAPIARELGLEVYTVEDWPNEISGAIVKEDNQSAPAGYVILLNGKHSSVRKRFTTAHEIAHFILHREMIGDAIQDDALYRSGLSNQIETQANRLAADILMPRHLIREVVASGKAAADDVRKMASIFEVSRDAMSIRLLGVQYTQENAAPSL